MGEHLIDFGNLFGKMHVDWAACGLFKDRGQAVGINRTQRMGGNADGEVCRTGGNSSHGILMKAQEPFGVISKPPLPAIQSPQIATTELVVILCDISARLV